MIKVLLVDDSNVIKKIIKDAIQKDTNIQIVETASNGVEACEKSFMLKPDIIIMDIKMPFRDGFEAAEIIMSRHPVPIIIITSMDQDQLILDKLNRLGIVAIIKKPKGFDYQETIKKVIFEIKKHTTIYAKINQKNISSLAENTSNQDSLIINKKERFIPKIICIGSSTGGPDALAKLLLGIKIKLEIPIIIIQHITAGFNNDLVKWLNPLTLMNVKIAENGEKLSAGFIYIPSDNSHLLVKNDGTCYNSCEKLDPFVCPSIDVTFKSVAKIFKQNTLGIILTGMGKDGAEGMLDIHRAGGYTIAQDKESSIIFGMPKASISKNVVNCILNINKIGEYISEIYLSEYGKEK